MLKSYIPIVVHFEKQKRKSSVQDRNYLSKKVNKKLDSLIKVYVKNTYKNANILIHINQKYLNAMFYFC